MEVPSSGNEELKDIEACNLGSKVFEGEVFSDQNPVDKS